MELLKPYLLKLIKESASGDKFFKRNLLKQYLQIAVLDFIYSHPRYSHLIFYGGSCLVHCYNLSRLSEDLDFVDLSKKVKMAELANDLAKYFKENTDLEVVAKPQKFRVYLKFSLLHELGLARKEESNQLFLKVEVFSGFDFCKKYRIDTVPLFKFNKSILIKTFDLSTLFSTKIRAVLFRRFEKTDKKGKVTIKVKGRDYFDLMWYLEKGIKPNLDCLENIKNEGELKAALLKSVSKIDPQSIYLDLEALVDNRDYVKNLSRNIKEILKKKLSE